MRPHRRSSCFLSQWRIVLFVVAAAFVSSNAANADELFGITAGSATGSVVGHLVKIDPLTGIGVDVGVPIPGTGLTGLAFDGTGRLLATTSLEGGPARLIEIDPTTGALVSVIADLTYLGAGQAVTDLSYDPVTGKMYASSAFGAFGNNAYLEVDMTTGALTYVGDIISEGGFKALGISDSGVHYSIANFGEFLYEIDPTDASTISTMGLGAAATIGALGMTVSPSGLVYFTNGNNNGIGFGRDLWVFDTGSGTSTLIGSIGIDGNVHDLAYFSSVIPEPTSWAICSVVGLAIAGGYRRRRVAK